MGIPKKVRLGDLLISSGDITEEQLQSALKYQEDHGGKLGSILVELNYIDEVKLANTIASQLNLPYVDLKHYNLNPDTILKLPERAARRFRAILIDIVNGEFIVGMVDPTDLIAYDELGRILEGKVKVQVVTESDLLRIIDLIYRRTEDIASFAKELKEELGRGQAAKMVSSREILSADSAPVGKMLDSIFEDAVQIGASDIHIEPDEKFLRIRQRVDGVLHENMVHGTEIISALVLRIKLMANLNISEKRLPQDGRFHMQVKGHYIDVRVSTMPVYYGESVVMRLLDKSLEILRMDQLGMSEEILKATRSLIHKPYGMFLVTGPTGSGKTTTLYAALTELNIPEDMIITIEDPVEYTLPRVNQVQVNPHVGLSFASVLRSALRQDPDIVLVGEMRDEETVQIGLRASITGHLVLSTLHTNDAISTAVRLIDMKAQGYLVASALRGVLAQRLMRRICESCKVLHEPTKEEQFWLTDYFKITEHVYNFKQGKGCSRCNQTGYRGRIGVYELLIIDEKLADALRVNDTLTFLHLAKNRPNYKSLPMAAFDYAVEGITTLEEVLRIIGEF